MRLILLCAVPIFGLDFDFLRTRQRDLNLMVETTRDFAFEELKLHRLELDVYSFNPRAERVYQKAGFRREGVLRVCCFGWTAICR